MMDEKRETKYDCQARAHRFSHKAMATGFEVIILYDDADYAEQAAWTAFDELDRLEGQLSRFIANSDICRINNLGVDEPLQIGLAAFECLQLCDAIYAQTGGAFDVTIGSGMESIKLNESRHTVELTDAAITIDLGGVGKGYAVDRMAELLREWDIDAALIHSGGSSVFAYGTPNSMKGWPVTLSNPGVPKTHSSRLATLVDPKQTLARVLLKNGALSGSGLQKGAHIVDPRRGRPVEDRRAAWACAADAATADALSTAFMVMTPEEIEQYCLQHPDVKALIITEEKGREKDKILWFGAWETCGEFFSFFTEGSPDS
jgi:thiamine biosynthesis lipoprotein